MDTKVALIGASGRVGRAILNELLNRGFKVDALVRNPDKLKLDNPNLTVTQVDASNESSLANDLKGFDNVISAYNPGWSNPNIYQETLENYPKILKAAIQAGVKRLLIVGGAGTLFVKPGLRLMDTGTLPKEWLPGVTSLGKFYLETLMKNHDIDWVFFSPAAFLEEGVRTGKYRLGKDDLMLDENGKSSISLEDYAKAMVDELEEPKHHRERFTIGY